MGRRRTGWIRRKAGRYYVGLTLRSGRPHERPVPAPENGAPLDKKYLDLVRATLVRDYELGAWDPESVPVPAEAPPADPTFYELVHEFVSVLTYESAPKDRARAALYLRGCPIANVRVRALKPAHGVALISHLIALPSKHGGTLGGSSVRNTFDLSQRAIDVAVMNELLPVNPFRLPLVRAHLPEKSDKDPTARKGWEFSREEFVQLISDPRILPDRRVMHAILLFTGMRPGELAVLRFADWNRSIAPLGRITVALARKSVSKVEGVTKSRATKVVPVHPTLLAILAEWHERGWAQLLGRAPRPDDYIVPTVRGPRKGQPRDGRGAVRGFHKDCGRLGIRQRHLYCTRHTMLFSVALGEARRTSSLYRLLVVWR
jgi:integrase